MISSDQLKRLAPDCLLKMPLAAWKSRVRKRARPRTVLRNWRHETDGGVCFANGYQALRSSPRIRIRIRIHLLYIRFAFAFAFLTVARGTMCG